MRGSARIENGPPASTNSRGCRWPRAQPCNTRAPRDKWQVWDDHEGAFSRLALQHSAKDAVEYAASVCESQLKVCETRTSRKELYAHDPGSKGARDEL